MGHHFILLYPVLYFLFLSIPVCLPFYGGLIVSRKDFKLLRLVMLNRYRHKKIITCENLKQTGLGRCASSAGLLQILTCDYFFVSVSTKTQPIGAKLIIFVWKIFFLWKTTKENTHFHRNVALSSFCLVKLLNILNNTNKM